MENSLASISIDKDLVKGIVEKQIQAAIVEAMGDPKKYMEAMVHMALHQKVDRTGKVSSYSSDNKYDYIDKVLEAAISEAANEAVKVWIKVNAESMKEALIIELDKEATKNAIIQALIASAVNSFNEWKFNCTVAPVKQD
jgi:DNA-binding protein YbaB